MSYNEKIRFRLFSMPCCGQQLCWVNPRLPFYCPECGEVVLSKLNNGDGVLMDTEGWLKVV